MKRDSGGAPPEAAGYVNDARYARLGALLDEARAHVTGSAADVVDSTVRGLLIREARLLDDGRYDEWLSQFAAECLYWVPSRYEPGDPRYEPGIYLDDRRRLADRVAMIRTGHFHAQIPRSRVRRMLSDMESWTASEGRTLARANIVIWEHRKAETRAYPGWQAYEIVRETTGTLVLATKIVCLLDCDAPQGNYSFIY